MESLTGEEMAVLAKCWQFVARTAQLPPPGKWRYWAMVTGRGFGKTRSLSEFAHDKAAVNEGPGFIAARTLKDARKAIIGHTTAGLITTSRPENPCDFVISAGQMRWGNGCYADVHTSEEPDSARGPEYAWGIADEVGTWKRTVDFKGNDTWTNLRMGLRAGEHPQAALATTPRHNPVVHWILDQAKKKQSRLRLVTGSLYDNRANLAPDFVADVLDTYMGTRFERQEVYGELLMDVEGAVLTWEQIEETRIDIRSLPELRRVIISVDPNIKSKVSSDRPGIVAVGVGADGDAYVLGDHTPEAGRALGPKWWASEVVRVYHAWGAQAVIAEDNQGGEMVKLVIEAVDAQVGRKVKLIPAKTDKAARAQPVLSLYEQGRVHHVGRLTELERQLCLFTATGYEGSDSPDNADALVHGVRDLLVKKRWGYREIEEAEARIAARKAAEKQAASGVH